MVYFQGGGSIRFAVGFVAGLLLRETAQRKSKKPPRSLLVPARRDQKDGEMIFVRQLEAEDFDKVLMDFHQQWRDRWGQDEAGANGYKYTFPDGLKAFSLVRDNGMPTNQIGVYVRDACVPGFLHNS